LASKIEDYALIGDCQTAALVSREGSIDWLCLPRFDSGACFAALLGTADNGRWVISPAAEEYQVTRSYRGDTLVLDTRFRTATGEILLTDFMPMRDGGRLNIVRIVRGVRGEVPVRLELTLRFDYGSIVPWVQRTKDGITAIAGPDRVHIHADRQLHGKDLTTISEFTLKEGEEAQFTMNWHPSHLPEEAVDDAQKALDRTLRWWQEWSKRCKYDGEWRKHVMRSLITLKALTYDPTGGIVAAPTTSLPEQFGGVRNWDYRFCWLRDSTFTLLALLDAGYVEEAHAWREWLLRAIAGSPNEASIMYGISGERRLTELELEWLPGYESSRPVRIGNAAHKQFQLDVFGELADTFYQSRRSGLKTEAPAWKLEKALLDFLESNWQKPDEGIWEMRGPRRHFTHSKMMAWVSVDRAVRSAEEFELEGPVKKWKALRDQIHDEVCAQGFDADVGAFTQFYGSKNLDASLLMMALVGFLPPTDARVIGTVQAIENNLLTPEKFVLRYTPDESVDGLPEGEATFLPCTFWLADNLALQHRNDEAREVFERLIGICNDVGLLAEEYDTRVKRMAGNFPQALSHIGLVNTAYNLDKQVGPAKKRKAA
jgi:GH15 family glucan-1,4-alpha-glucosidase